jgi:hypothetical protein
VSQVADFTARYGCVYGARPVKDWHVQWETVPPGGERVRIPIVWVADVEETKRMKPTDTALGAVSESPGRNESEPTGGLDTKEPGGRALSVGAKAAWHDAN